MQTGRPIGFSIRLCSFFAEQDRMLDAYFKTESSMTYGDFTLAYALLEVGRAYPLEPLARFLMLKPRTVRNTALSLENRALLRKSSDPHDARFMLLELTEAGAKETGRSAAEVFGILEEGLFAGLPESEFGHRLRPSMRVCLDHVRGGAIDGFGAIPASFPYPMAVDHLVFWRNMLSRWRSIAHEGFDLSLSCYCVLRCLEEHGSMFSVDVSDELLLPLSTVSLCRQRLEARGLIAQCGGQAGGKRMPLSPTAEGVRVSGILFSRLDDETRLFHEGMDAETSDIVNAWYMRMFANMWSARRR